MHAFFLQVLLELVMIRRLKADVLCELPGKHRQVAHAPRAAGAPRPPPPRCSQHDPQSGLGRPTPLPLRVPVLHAPSLHC
jgi:hypothetical protein